MMKLYDIRTNDYIKDGLQVGDTLRSIQVYQCEMCYTKTNLWGIGSFYGRPKVMIGCPAGQYIEHFEIERLLMLGSSLETKLVAYGVGVGTVVNSQKLNSVFGHLRDEREVVAELLGLTRELFAGLHDVVGEELLPEIQMHTVHYEFATKSLRDPSFNKQVWRHYYFQNMEVR